MMIAIARTVETLEFVVGGRLVVGIVVRSRHLKNAKRKCREMQLVPDWNDRFQIGSIGAVYRRNVKWKIAKLALWSRSLRV